MTILTLTKVWINRNDTGEGLSAYSDPASGNEQWANDGGVRLYASGRRRAYTIEGEGGEVPFTLVELTYDQVETLREWKGLNVQVRDHRGRKWFGVYLSVAVTPIRNYVTVYTAGFTLQTTTTVEGV